MRFFALVFFALVSAVVRSLFRTATVIPLKSAA